LVPRNNIFHEILLSGLIIEKEKSKRVTFSNKSDFKHCWFGIDVGCEKSFIENDFVAILSIALVVSERCCKDIHQ
jgi:hypothetical protein